MIQVILCYSFQDGHCEPLGHLSSVGAQEVEADDLVILVFLADHLRVTILCSVPVHIPFQRFIDTTPGNNVLFSKFLLSVFLTVPAGSVLNGSKNGSGHVFVAHHSSFRGEESFGQKFSCHDSGRSQFQSSLANISNGENIGNWSFIIISCYNLSVRSCFDSHWFQVESFGVGWPSNCEENGIKNIFNFVFSLLEPDHLFAFCVEGNGNGNCLLDEFNSLRGHIVSYFLCDLLVETSEEDRSDHNSNVHAQGVQETSTFKRNIWSSNAKGPSWSFRQPEDIIWINGVLFPRDIGITRSASSRQKDILSSDSLFLAISVCEFDAVSWDQPCKFVVVYYFLLIEFLLVTPIDWFDVICDSWGSLLPIVGCIVVNLPATFGEVLPWFSEESGVVEKLFGDATHIDACASQAPLGSIGRWLYKVS